MALNCIYIQNMPFVYYTRNYNTFYYKCCAEHSKKSLQEVQHLLQLILSLNYDKDLHKDTNLTVTSVVLNKGEKNSHKDTTLIVTSVVLNIEDTTPNVASVVLKMVSDLLM